MTDLGSDSTATAYATALAAGKPQRLLGLLSTTTCFQSPYSLWQTPESVAAAFHARCRAFQNLQVERVLQDGRNAVLLWNAEVDGQAVDGCEALTMSAGQVSRVDVFLRPAAVLENVRSAMTAAWPKSNPSRDPSGRREPEQWPRSSTKTAQLLLDETCLTPVREVLGAITTATTRPGMPGSRRPARSAVLTIRRSCGCSSCS